MSGRRAVRRSSLAVAAAVLGLGALVACKPATPAVDIGGPRLLAVAADDTVAVSLSCAGTAPCSGETRVRLSGRNGPVVTYAVPAGSTASVTVPLGSSIAELLPTGTTLLGEVRITERAPAAVASRGISVFVANPAPPTSKAYRERNWTPTAFDTCSEELHASYSVVGPDGKLYPTWHPPTVVDPATGETCTFGHEHGDDPTTSDIYEWVTDFLDADPDESRGIPFGYVSEALDTYAADRDGVTRHEDNVGHKVIVENDVAQVAASPRGYVRDDTGAVVTCDVLMKVHQGSHSGDALINNAHELLYAAQCSDGTEVIASLLTRFGDANEFQRSCNGDLVATSGSDLPDGEGGARFIPDRWCVDRDILVPEGQTSSIWSLYEVWRSESRLLTADGQTLAHVDPWFGVRNPARAHDGGDGASIFDLVDVTDMTDVVDDGYACGYPFDGLRARELGSGEQVAKADPTSPFDGAQRDHYLHTTEVTNGGGPSVWYTDPYGGSGVTTPAAGFVRQWVSSTDNSAWPELERRSFDLDRDFGADNGVHAPN